MAIKINAILFFFLLAVSGTLVAKENRHVKPKDSIYVNTRNKVTQSIYSGSDYRRGKFYNFLWGKHYRDLYYKPVSLPSVDLDLLHGGLHVIDNVPKQYGLLMENNKGDKYLLRLLGGYTTFMESSFFKSIYNPQEYKDTYLDDFIKDAYTITNPYTFVVADRLANKISLNGNDSQMLHIASSTLTDTLIDGSSVKERLVSLSDLNQFSEYPTVLETDSILRKIKESKLVKINNPMYIRERLFDMLVGDWNKTNDNWKWLADQQIDSTLLYSPLVVDRQHAFTKVDGFFFKGILGMFGLKSITNYDYRYGNLKKINGYSLALDVALTGETDEQQWLEQARFVKENLTDDIIDHAFSLLPQEIRGNESELIKSKLKQRRNSIEAVASKYYKILQKTPVITGTNGDDRFEIDRIDSGNMDIKIYDKEDHLVYNKIYDKQTNEIWIYGLDGDDRFNISGSAEKHIPIVLIGGKGENSYHIENNKNLKIYEYESYKRVDDSLSNAKIIQTDIEDVHAYDFNKLKYSTFEFTPWGVYDSDLGLYLGLYLTNTMYGFKRAPYTYRHRIGYNYLNGFQYQGFFPTYDDKKVYVLEAFVGTPNNFVNFFGYGNETNGYKDEKKKYNRVNLSRYSLAPSFNFKFDDKQRLIAQTSFDLYKISDSNDRFVNNIYYPDDSFFDTKTFADFNLTYKLTRNFFSFMPKFDFSLTSGWRFNLGDLKKNYAYAESSLALDFGVTDRLTLATEFTGTALFTDDKYEFYYAASTNLRGFRGNRFIGNRSAYQRTDLRLDLGRLKNPIAPILYGVFVGLDYGRVWYAEEDSRKWHNSYGGGLWITLFKSYTGKFSYFSSKDGNRLSFGLGMGF